MAADWPERGSECAMADMVHLLQAVAERTPQMLACDLELHASTLLAHPEAQPLDALFTIFALWAGTEAPGSAR
jgi:hypothetical protein